MTKATSRCPRTHRRADDEDFKSAAALTGGRDLRSLVLVTRVTCPNGARPALLLAPVSII